VTAKVEVGCQDWVPGVVREGPPEGRGASGGKETMAALAAGMEGLVVLEELMALV